MGFFPFSSCLSRRVERKNSGKKRAKVYLNVYDISPVNNYLYWFGLGIFHSGIEVHGVEYAFGLEETSGSGVFEIKPKNCPGFTFRRSIRMGTTDMSSSEISTLMKNLSSNYNGDTYDLLTKNCNHFSNDVCKRLTGKQIPGWVNRVARIGCFIESLLCEDQDTSGRYLPENRFCSGHCDHSGASSVSGEVEAEEEQSLLGKSSSISHRPSISK